jgi:hypothetical protein
LAPDLLHNGHRAFTDERDRHRVGTDPRRATQRGGVGRAEEGGGVMLLDSLFVVYPQHERCGELHFAVEGDRVWMACTHGAAISRRIHDD